MEADDEEEGARYGDENDRTYRAFGGSKRCPMLLFIPHPEHPKTADFDRLFPYIHIQFVEARKDGTELWIEFPYLVVLVTGRNLRIGALGLGAHTCSRLEAFDAARRDMPSDPSKPFISTIEYKVRKNQPDGKAQPAKKHEPETLAKQSAKAD